jgi:hypothetical protein
MHSTERRHAPSTPTMLSVYDGRECVGFLFHRGLQGVELFDREQRSLGIFPTQRAAVAELDRVRT